MCNTMLEVSKKIKSRQVTAFGMGLGSSFLKRVVIPYTNSPSTNPIANIEQFLFSAKFFDGLSFILRTSR